ncbi:hypothetical protein [Eisenbergiella sp.]
MTFEILNASEADSNVLDIRVKNLDYDAAIQESMDAVELLELGLIDSRRGYMEQSQPEEHRPGL